jgi:acetate kinase
MHILSLNVGSSSLKYTLFDMPSENLWASGNLKNCNTLGNLAQAVKEVIEQCQSDGIDAIAHRVVHGGRHFSLPTQINKQVIETLHGLRVIDPLHNPTEISMIELGLKLLPNTPAIAVFDTAFHQTLPEVASRYALPWEMSERLGIRRYGFHGISHRYVSEVLLQCLGREETNKARKTKLILCHLGSGASVCAVLGGKSVDTSMGFTPLEGLIMGTRCGDIDPGVLLYLLRTQGMTVAQLDDLLNQESGLKGLAGHEGDLEQLEHTGGVAMGDTRAQVALEMFAYRVQKYIGAYAAAMGGVDAIAFTGGIGQHSPLMRARICANLGFLGVHLNKPRNDAATMPMPARISRTGGRVPVWVIPTDEERQMAREAYILLQGGK